ncbi:hypothetical protein [uncultured Parabacteroides sp.]|uniref:hypothetical protein n=1 Tax=uncultured Parabacteroides sp. TaxID=512312 RepID=UPI002585464C|nr:hypothetical protein [uncultured Parabacteroides sp.]
MKKWLYLVFTALFFFSCSEIDDNIPDNNDEDNNGDKDNIENENDMPVLNLYVNTDQKNIFDLMEFQIQTEGTVMLSDLRAHYDSVVWKVSGLDGSYKIFERTDFSSSFSFKWSHNFFFPGEYETFLLGYKEDKLIYKSDTLPIKITDDKDFLGYNWKDIKGFIGHGTGYVDVLFKDRDIVTFQDMHQDTPSVELSLLLNGNQDEQAFILKSEKILSDYISSLYSSSIYDLTDDTLVEKYNKIFTYKKENAYPQCIWLTPKSKIVLLKCYDKYFKDYFKYEIYAEPGDEI